jgi:branched-chain amino acid aminotransferase
LNPCRRICSPLPRLSANPPWRPWTSLDIDPASLRADDEARTRDLNLGKVALYQLSYVRLQPPVSLRCGRNHSRTADAHKLGGKQRAARVAEPVVARTNVGGMRAWVNGRVLEDPEAPAIAVTDHGMTVGDGVFEAVKVVDGRPFALTRHLDRLARSAASLRLPAPDLDELRGAVAEVLAGDPLPLGRLRLTYTGGPAPLGSGRGDGGPTTVVVAAPMPPAAPTTSVHRVAWPRNERGVLAGVKSTSYAENVVALAEAERHGASEAIFANLAGHLCEGTGTNVGYVVGGEVRTPSLRVGCLAGVTRALLLEWYDVREVDEPIAVLDSAEEIFLMSTTRDIQGVRCIDGREIESPGQVTRRLMDLWAAKAAEDPDP